MDTETVETYLESAETGVLALSKADDAYAIPVAHYYDGKRLHFRLGLTEGSEKQEFIESTERACYVAYGTEETDDPRELDSWSVLVTGGLEQVRSTDQAPFDEEEINRRFSPVRVFDEPIDEIEISLVTLEIETITGRITPSQ